jgi:hypothetical protein
MKKLFLGDDLIRPYHLVVFMFKNMAMPDVAELVARFRAIEISTLHSISSG